jgi:hypothetical protein
MGVILSGCAMGGGHGKYYPPGIKTNSIEVSKVDLTGKLVEGRSSKSVLGSDIDKYRILTFPYYPNNPPDDEFRAGLKKYYYSREFVFDSKSYKIAIPLTHQVSIFDSNGKLVTKLKLPRLSSDAYAFELISNKRRMLIVYVEQQATSHSSTLFILDEKFSVVYKEHLLGALWIAAPRDIEDSNFILGAERKWLDHDDELLVFGGPWHYFVGDK